MSRAEAKRRWDMCTRHRHDVREFLARVDGKLYGGICCDGCAARVRSYGKLSRFEEVEAERER